MADNSISESQRLLAEIEAKYGRAPSTQPAPQPAQQPAQQAPQPQAKKHGSMLEGAMNLFGNRGKQIDKAAGYACGGKVKAHAQGGKIKGPGTPTSDSIPAKIQDTGEQILVSNGERILSKEQDDLLLRIAQMLGFETVDALLESGTGKPVGPTMKGGKRAAEAGWSIANEPDEYNKAAPFQNVLPPIFGAQDSKVGPSTSRPIVADMASAIAKPFQASAEQARSDMTGLEFERQKKQQTQPSGLLAVATAPGFGPDAGPQSPASKADLVGGRNMSGVITADTAAKSLGADMQRSGGIFGTSDVKGVNDILARENKIRGEMIDMMPTGFATPTAPMMPGQLLVGEVAPGVTRIDAENAEKTRRWQMEDYVRQASRGNQVAIGAAMKEIGDTAQQELRNQGDLQKAGIAASMPQQRNRKEVDPLDAAEKQLEIDSKQRLANLQNAYLNAKTPQERETAGKLLMGLSGKTGADRFAAHVVGGGVNDLGQAQPQHLAVTGPDGSVRWHRPGEGGQQRRQVTDQEISDTAKKYGITPEQVKQKLGLA